MVKRGERQIVQAVIFDIDGTIIDSVGLHIESFKRAFQKFGKECSYESIRRQIGKGADEFLAAFFAKEELDRFSDDFSKNIAVNFSNKNIFRRQKHFQRSAHYFNG